MEMFEREIQIFEAVDNQQLKVVNEGIFRRYSPKIGALQRWIYSAYLLYGSRSQGRPTFWSYAGPPGLIQSRALAHKFISTRGRCGGQVERDKLPDVGQRGVVDRLTNAHQRLREGNQL